MHEASKNGVNLKLFIDNIVNYIKFVCPKTKYMKARQSKSAKLIFLNESKGRTILREIHSADDPHVDVYVKFNNEHWRIKEVE